MALCRCSRGSGGRPAPAPYSARHSALSLRWLWRLPATQHGRSAVPPRRQLRGRSYRRASALEALQRLLPPRLAAALPPRATRPQIIGEIGVIRLGAASELRNSRYLPLLGQVVLEKNQQLQTIAVESPLSPDQVSACGGRDPYSLSEWHTLAGVPSLRTTVMEHGRPFSVDLGSCFWNGKRATERRRLTTDIIEYCRMAAQAPGAVQRVVKPVLVCDLTAGVGALAVHVAAAAAAGALPVVVAANDWNHSASAMAMYNRARNQLTNQQLQVSTLPVSDFVRELATQPERWSDAGAVLVLDAPRPEGIFDLLGSLRPLLLAHVAIAASAVSPAPLRLYIYAMAPPQMLTPVAWEARLAHEWALGTETSPGQLQVPAVVQVRSVGKGWTLVCVTVDWWTGSFPYCSR